MERTLNLNDRNNAPNKNEMVIRNEAGDLEVIDLHTGEVVLNDRWNLPASSDYAFDYRKALYICQLVRQGKTLKEIALLPKMPPLEVIHHWQRIDRMFAEEMKLARRERGEQYFDNAMAIAKEAASGHIAKDDVPAMTLASNLYKWGAERSKPESYGNKVTHEGNAEKPILMRVINTGISRARPDVVLNGGTNDSTDTKEIIDATITRGVEGSGKDEDDQGAHY